MIERFNRTSKIAIKQVQLKHNDKTYIDILNEIVFNYNHVPHSVTKKTPFSMYFGNEKTIQNALQKSLNYIEKRIFNLEIQGTSNCRWEIWLKLPKAQISLTEGYW